MKNLIAIILVLGTPAAAILGGILAGILKTRGQHRLIELAQRERIAAIERGLDISQLPPVWPGNENSILSASQAGIRKAQGLTIGGLLTFALGLGLIFTLLFLPLHDGRDAWSIGFVPIFMGIALLLSARIVRRGLDESA
ncbi:MAG TPA: DUF6249 domain-containing protein [Thermoanaerobaculia bacterium]|nr:DUF6249 domain-containing protein [Thermoanaerobaculia bacterium]